MTPKITAPTQYKNCIITPRTEGFDIIDLATHRWFTVTTQKQAKWWASVHSRIQAEFSSHTTRLPPVPLEDHTPKPKGKS